MLRNILNASLFAALALTALAQTPPVAPTRANILRGEYGRYRANNDLLFYHLDVRVDPERKYLSGKVAIRFKMLQDATRIQLDLHAALQVDRILLGDTVLKYERDSGAVFVDFPSTFPLIGDVPRSDTQLPVSSLSFWVRVHSSSL